MIHKIEINNTKQFKVTIYETKKYVLTIDSDDIHKAKQIALLAVSTDQGKIIEQNVSAMLAK